MALQWIYILFSKYIFCFLSYIQIFLRNSTTEGPYQLRVPGCDLVCPWDHFLRLTSKKVPLKSYNEECKSNNPNFKYRESTSGPWSNIESTREYWFSDGIEYCPEKGITLLLQGNFKWSYQGLVWPILRLCGCPVTVELGPSRLQWSGNSWWLAKKEKYTEWAKNDEEKLTAVSCGERRTAALKSPG